MFFLLVFLQISGLLALNAAGKPGSHHGARSRAARSAEELSAESPGGLSSFSTVSWPLAWIHFPKTGTSFANTLFQHRGICPSFPQAVFDDSWHNHDAILYSPGNSNLRKLLDRYPKDQHCPGAFSQTYNAPPGHSGIGDVYDQNKGRVIAFFRRPEARLVSGYRNAQHSFPAKQLGGRIAVDVLDYAKYVNGCYVKMLTRGDQHRNLQTCGRLPLPEKSEVHLAVKRVDEMQFVGLTEEWDLSICLFHKVFGEPCKDLEFMDSRPANVTNRNPSMGTKPLMRQLEQANFTDKYDGPVYEAAVKKFWKMMKDHNLNRASCETVCKDATKTKPFTIKVDALKSLGDQSEQQFDYDWPGRPTYSDPIDDDDDTENQEGDMEDQE